MSSNSSVQPVSCYFLTATWVLSGSQTFIRMVLVLPLFTLVLRLAYRQRRTSAVTSHSDIFTCHVAAMELIWLLGVTLAYFGVSTYHNGLMKVGKLACSIIIYGELSFHALGCVEWYLAVVHPVTYREMRGARGVTARNVIIAALWLLSFGLMAMSSTVPLKVSGVVLLCFLCFSVSVISYCSLSVVWVLVQPAPGERGKETQSKQRPTVTILSIWAVLWVWLVGSVISILLVNFNLLRCEISYLVESALGWFNLPSSVVTPVLYLHRAGRLSCGHRLQG